MFSANKSAPVLFVKSSRRPHIDGFCTVRNTVNTDYIYVQGYGYKTF